MRQILLDRWGYRRCEDISWLKTNKDGTGACAHYDETTVFQSTIEHCLMGRRGDLRRDQDSHLMHCNVDIGGCNFVHYFLELCARIFIRC